MHTAVLKEINSTCECFSKEVILEEFEAYFEVLEREVFHESVEVSDYVDFRSGHKRNVHRFIRQKFWSRTYEFVYLTPGVWCLRSFFVPTHKSVRLVENEFVTLKDYLMH